VTLRFEGYKKSPDGFGTGTYEVLHPKGASIEITRSLFEGDVLKITSVRNTPDPAPLHMLNDAGIPHSIAFTACKENVHCITSILDICRETCVSHLNISKLQPDNVTGLSPISFSEWKQLKARARNEAPDVTIPSVCRETGCIGGVLGLSVLPDGTYWDCALNQEVVGRYPSSIRDLLYWEYIRAGTARDSFETCLRGEACVRYS
jgi:MoaA/NifB/PqqE/SkfB family radical SAM enzyme